MAQTLGTLLIDVKADTQQLIKGFDRAENAVKKTTKTMTNSVKLLTSAFIGLSAVDLGKSLSRQADTMVNINSKLKLVTKSTEELTKAQTELFKIAQQTRTGFADNVDLFQRISMSTNELGLSQKEVLNLTESINKSLTISGTTAEGASALIMQLGQAFSSNFQAVSQELNTLKDQAPSLYQALLKGTGKTSAEFKKMAEDGELSSQLIIDAIKKQEQAIDEDFGKMAKNISQSYVQIQNASIQFIGNLDEITGASKAVSDTFTEISKSIESISSDDIDRFAQLAKIVATVGLSYLATTKAIKSYNSISALLREDSEAILNLEQQKIKAQEAGVLFRQTSAASLKQENISKKASMELYKAEKQAVESQNKLQIAKNRLIEANTNITSLNNKSKTISFDNSLRQNKTALSNIKELALIEEASAKRNNETAIKAFKNAQIKSESAKKTADLLKKEVLLTEKAAIAQTKLSLQTNRTSLAVKSLSAALRTLAPIAIASGIIAIADALFTANKNAETFEETMASTGEELKKLTKNQLEYVKAVLESEIATERLALANAKADSANQGIFETNREHLKDKAFTDEKIKNFELLTKKLREVKTLLDDTNRITLPPIEVESTSPDKPKGKTTPSKDILTTSLSDWENYYQTVGDMSTAWLIKEAELRTQYIDLTEEQFKKVAEVAKTEYFDKLEEFSFKLNIDASGFDGVAKALVSTSSAFAELGDEQKSFNKFSKEYAKIQEPTLKDKEKFNKAEKQHISNQLNGYSAIAGAIGGLYAKGERQASAFQAIQASIALVEGVTAILSQGKGDPYTAGARMAAMGATVASLLSSAKIAFGFGGVKTTTTSDAFSAQVENTGIGSTLGDSAQASESITSSLEVLEDFAQPQFRVLSQMNKSLFTIAERIGGLSSLLIQTGGFAFGAGFTGSSSNRQNIKSGSLQIGGMEFSGSGGLLSAINTVGAGILPIGEMLEEQIFGSTISSILSGLENKVLGGLFGKSSSSSELRDYGINFNQALLTSAINQINGQAFQTIATTVTKKSWFKSSSSTTIQTFFRDLNEETERQFSLVLSDLYNTTIKAGEALDQSSKDVENSLSSFVVNIGKISTKGKTGAEIQEQISNVFSKIGDDIASTAFPELDEFQKVGEGMFTTLTRVATGMQEAEFFIKRLGGTFEDIQFTDILNKQGDVGFEALAQSIIKADEAMFGFDNGVVKIIETLSGSAEELFTAYNTLEDVRVNLELTGQSAKNLSSAMIVGAGSIDALSDATDEYFENFLTEQEQLQSKTQQLNKEFAKLNVSMPTSVKGFKDLIGNIDTSTDAGAELYGRLISLSEGFSDVFGSIKDVEKLRSSFIQLGESVGKTINSLIGGTDKAQQQTNTIESFWKKRNEADELIAKNATLTSSEQARLSTLVGEINTLAGTIQSGSIGNSSIITDELIGTLSILEDSLDLQNEILKVNIVGINDDVNLLTGAERTVPNISNTINPNIPLGDSKDTLNAILDNIITMKDDLSDMLDNSNALINGFAVPKVEVIP